MIVKKNIERLEQDINEMENLLDLNAPDATVDLKKKRLELKTLLEERVKGALIQVWNKGNKARLSTFWTTL